ncbi:Rhodopsin, GQ-coupled [Trichoplax sp. H2]|nr:Rhodopsin, GQ-coupled [Trichoplax sp. H2]|eukprot:RDD37220.1 Rhodopsin, GQ-coupled [Trichoplax sp. H2]
MANSSYNYSLLTITSFTCIPVGVVGTITNVFLLIIISTSKSLKDPGYKIISNIIACDGISSIQFFVIFLGPYLLTDSTFYASRIYCRILFCSMYSTYNVSAFSLTAISFHRCKIVIKASQTRFKKLELQKINRLIAIIWIFSYVFSVPVIFFTDTSKVVTGYCDISYVQGYSYLTLVYFVCMAAVTYTIPLIAMTINYARLIKRLQTHITPGENQISTLLSRRRDQVTRTLIAVTSIFMLFNGPLFITFICMAANLKNYYLLRNENFIVYFISLLALPMALFVSAINPIFYISFDKNILEVVMQKLGMKSEDNTCIHSVTLRSKSRKVLARSNSQL